MQKYSKTNECRITSCEKCGYCHTVADQVVKINPDLPKLLVEKIPEIKDTLGGYLNRLHTGEIFQEKAAV